MLRHSCLALALAGVSAAALVHADEVLHDGIAAQVGSDIVLVSEVLERVAPVEQKMRSAKFSPQDIAKLRASGLEALIEETLIAQIVTRSELYATDTEIDRTIDMIARENSITREQLERSVSAQGLSIEEYRSELKSELERRKVVSMMVASKVEVEEEEVRRLFEKRFADQPEGGETLHLRQILVGNDGSAIAGDDPACDVVRDAHKRVKAGESFEKIASEISQVAPAHGGDIGWLHTDSLANWMIEIVSGLEAGDVTGVVELPFGCSMLKLMERRAFAPMTYADAKEPLQMELYEKKLDASFREWMESVRENTYIERKGYFADAAMLGSKSGFAQPEEQEEEGEFLF
jgi:peptidyl-prolyl cis-trans isomerase SurA